MGKTVKIELGYKPNMRMLSEAVYKSLDIPASKYGKLLDRNINVRLHDSKLLVRDDDVSIIEYRAFTNSELVNIRQSIVEVKKLITANDTSNLIDLKNSSLEVESDLIMINHDNGDTLIEIENYMVNDILPILYKSVLEISDLVDLGDSIASNIILDKCLYDLGTGTVDGRGYLMIPSSTDFNALARYMFMSGNINKTGIGNYKHCQGDIPGYSEDYRYQKNITRRY